MKTQPYTGVLQTRDVLHFNKVAAYDADSWLDNMVYIKAGEDVEVLEIDRDKNIIIAKIAVVKDKRLPFYLKGDELETKVAALTNSADNLFMCNFPERYDPNHSVFPFRSPCELPSLRKWTKKHTLERKKYIEELLAKDTQQYAEK